MEGEAGTREGRPHNRRESVEIGGRSMFTSGGGRKLNSPEDGYTQFGRSGNESRGIPDKNQKLKKGQSGGTGNKKK